MNENGKVEIEAVANDDWSFVKWSDGVTDAKRTITYNDETNLTVTFTYMPLNKPNINHCEIDYDSKELTLTWRGDDNAKDYTITFDDMTFTSDTNSLTINDSDFEIKKYHVTIKANPKDARLHKESTYEEDLDCSYYLMNEIPDYKDGDKSLTLEDYKTKLKEAGFINVKDGEQLNWYLNVDDVTKGATKENDGTVAKVSPEVGKRKYVDITIKVYVYKYNSEN